MTNRAEEFLILKGIIIPPGACVNFNHHYRTMGYGTEIYFHKHIVEVTIKPRIFKDNLEPLVRRAILNVAGTLDGQLLRSGQVVQAMFHHPLLKRAEGEVILSTRSRQLREISSEHISDGIQIGQMAELVPPLAHALRDFRLSFILPPEDGATFLWRSIESVLWLLSDDNTNSAEDKRNINAVAQKLGVDPAAIKNIKDKVNHQYNFGRHASRIYRDRVATVRKTFGRTSAWFTTSLAIKDVPLDEGFPTSFTEDEWKEMLLTVHRMLVNLVPYLSPFAGYTVVPPWI